MDLTFFVRLMFTVQVCDVRSSISLLELVELSARRVEALPFPKRTWNLTQCHIATGEGSLSGPHLHHSPVRHWCRYEPGVSV